MSHACNAVVSRLVMVPLTCHKHAAHTEMTTSIASASHALYVFPAISPRLTSPSRCMFLYLSYICLTISSHFTLMVTLHTSRTLGTSPVSWCVHCWSGSCSPCSDACLIPVLPLCRSHVKYALTASLWTRCMPQAAITTSALAAGRVMWLQPSAKALHPSICAVLCQTAKLRYE